MRVGLDAHTLEGRPQGIRTYVANIARELIAQGDPADEVVLLGCAEGDVELGVHRASVSYRRWVSPLRGMRIALEVPVRELTLGLDVLHSQYIIPPVSLRPQVVTIHDILFERYPEWFAPRFVRRSRLLYRMSARRATVVVTDSEFSRRELVEHYGVAASRVRIVPLGCDHVLKRLAETAPDGAVDAAGTVPPRFHLFVGRIDPRKNLGRLVAAYRRLWNEGADIPPLVIAGRRDYRGDEIMLEMRGELESGRVIEWPGADDGQIARLYRAAEVVVYPSLDEGFGLPVLEAMAAGAAVVTSPCAAIREFAEDCVLYADPRSPDAIASAILRAAAGGDGIRALRERAVARAAQYTWKRTAEALWSIYREAARRGRSLATVSTP